MHCRARFKASQSRPDLQLWESTKSAIRDSDGDRTVGASSDESSSAESVGGLLVMGEDAVMGSDGFLHSLEEEVSEGVIECL
jgi:hypothetical protein